MIKAPIGRSGIQSPLHILIIEDNLGDAILLHASLKKAFPNEKLDVVHCQTLEMATATLKERSFDLITADLHLPDSLDLDSVMASKKLAPLTPVLVVSAWSDREAARRALQLGAQDYIIKGNFSAESLRWNIESAIERQRSRNIVEERQRQEIEKNKTKDEILSMTAHDIRGPLIGVIAYLNSILKGDVLSDLSSDQRRVFEMMLTNCDQVLTLSDEIVHAKKKALKLFQVHRELISLQSFFHELRTELESRTIEKHIEIHLDLKIAPRVFFFDAQLVKRAIGNLVHNAVRMADPKTIVEIAVKRSTTGLLITIQDQGPGVPEDLVSSLFVDPEEKQSSAELSDTPKGLGLVIVKRIAEAHGGRAWLESTSPTGSCFAIEIAPIETDA